jgi:tetratricopeptide (TPR) repeat protein
MACLPRLSGCGFITKLRARDRLNKGVKAFSEQNYTDAATLFEESIKLDPEFEVARMYLATTYTSQFVPGSPDPRSREMALKAISTFEDVLKLETEEGPNINAMLSIASLYYQLQEYEQSKDWCRRIQDVDPENAEALYRIAVINFDESIEMTGLQGENVEFMNEEEIGQTLQYVEEGLEAIARAIEMRPNYFDAMEYQNLLLREKAKFETDEESKAELIRQADLLAQQALVLRLQAEEEEAKLPKKIQVK